MDQLERDSSQSVSWAAGRGRPGRYPGKWDPGPSARAPLPLPVVDCLLCPSRQRGVSEGVKGADTTEKHSGWVPA
jgi:hypothetical protein